MVGIPPVIVLFAQYCFVYQVLLWFHMDFRIVFFSTPVKKDIEILASGRMAVLTIFYSLMSTVCFSVFWCLCLSFHIFKVFISGVFHFLVRITARYFISLFLCFEAMVGEVSL